MGNLSWSDFSFGHQMCSLARKATSAIFNNDEADEEEEDLEESGNVTSQSASGCKTIENHDTSSQPLTIPKESVNSNSNSSTMQLSDINISAFSKMSLDTIGSSMATSIGYSMAASLMGSSMASSASNTVVEPEDENGLPIITLEEVKNHFTLEDAWTIIYDRVYNVTSFLAEHPGGIYVMEDHLGFDATVAFRSTGHSTEAFTMLNKYLIGILPKNERIYEDRIRW